ncbi:MAG: DUF1553 domain-containing protein [Planctomycetota bacterium]|nr:MAG: DUF1553 domain-containing protein [Planctomycetota bacterium]
MLRDRLIRILLNLGSLLALACAAQAQEAMQPPADHEQLPPAPEWDFGRDIRPILAENCFRCHGMDEQKSGLRLDTYAGAFADLGGTFALVPGDLESSELWLRISTEDDFDQMPPAGEPESLEAEEIDKIRQWIEAGAPWGNHWAFEPIRSTAPPVPKDQAWGRNEIDAFILADLESAGLSPNQQAPRAQLLRRLSFDLIGLPPTPEQVKAFLEAEDPDRAYEEAVDRLLASPQFGERWARHWLDLVRFAETKGHEFDFPIPNAWVYRDYVIRAFQNDLPYDRLVQEHIAGDLLEPRRHPETGANEAVLGTGFFFLGEEVHSPVDPRGDELSRTANKIDVLSKTFLGLTVGCARCHDHKFDPITAGDYYALAGVLHSSSYRQVRFETQEQNSHLAEQLEELRAQYQEDFQTWLPSAPEPAVEPDSVFPAQASPESHPPNSLIYDFGAPGPEGILQDGFSFLSLQAGDCIPGSTPQASVPFFSPLDCVAFDPIWHRLKLAAETAKDPGDKSWVASGRMVRTPSFTVPASGRLHYLVRGAGRVLAVVDSHRMLSGPLHKSNLKTWKAEKPGFFWVSQNFEDYVGQRVFLEFSPGDPEEISLALAWIAEGKHAPPLPEVLGGDWTLENLNPVSGLDSYWPKQQAILDQIQESSQTGLALMEGAGFDEYLLLRGDPRSPAETVPRSFLSALRNAEDQTATLGSGRLALAQSLTRESNPLTSRVMVNRLWHHLFGRGLVATVDNFGALGVPPTHPQLLDWLAVRFMQEGWSIKTALRRMVTSSTYRQGHQPSQEARSKDPENLLWHHMPVRRLQGEAIRDAMLSVSGRLDSSMFGLSVPVHLTPSMQGRGRPGKSGPVDGDGRRSIYQEIRRNFLPPFMSVFDMPPPFSSMGKRTVSNVPAQSLAMMNSSFVTEQARLWAQRLLLNPEESTQERLHRMYWQAFGRSPRELEITLALEFLHQNPGEPLDAWADLAHVLFNTKEFLFLP